MNSIFFFCNYLVTYDMPNTVYLKETEELLYWLLEVSSTDAI